MRHLHRWLILPVLAALMVALALSVSPAGATSRGGHEVILSSPLAGSLPDDPALSGVLPGTAPWIVKRGHVNLRENGRLRINVRGLVIPTPPSNGTNPVPLLSASVFCAGTLAATTPTVPFSPQGDAQVDVKVALPEVCATPAVLVHPNTVTGRYIAFNGTPR